MENNSNLINICSVIANIIIACTAVFHELIRDFVFKPDLKVTFIKEPPDCNMNLEGEYIFRAHVTNKGKKQAQQVEVYASKLSMWTKNKYNQIPSFSPINLLWDEVKEPFINLSPNMNKLFVLGYLNKKRLGDQNLHPIYSFRKIIKYGDMFDHFTFGKYKIEITIGAANCKARTNTFYFSFSDEWKENIAEMLDSIQMSMD